VGKRAFESVGFCALIVGAVVLGGWKWVVGAGAVA
jgi:hypothetical protein